MLKIPVIKGDINKALKHFKRKLRERKQYIKPSLKRRIEKDEAIRKLKKQKDDE